MLIGSSSFALAMSAHLPTRTTTTIQPGRWRRRMLVERGEDGLLGEYGGWLHQSMRPAAGNIKGRWYAVNTRDPTRDETLREGLVRLGAVIERKGLPTTFPLPRYALAAHFAALLQIRACGIRRLVERNSPAALAGICRKLTGCSMSVIGPHLGC